MAISPREFARALNLSTVCATEREDDACIDQADLCRPGLQFAGYFDVFANRRPQVIGKTEMAYLAGLQMNVQEERLKKYFAFFMPCIVVARGMDSPKALLLHAKQHSVPVYATEIETSVFSAMAMGYLSEALAPRRTCHGVLMEVYGVGVMITGESGVGKSECALELIKNGHQLVADDVVDIARVGSTLFGEAPEMVHDFMEMRGVGVVDIKKIFGIGSIVRRAKIDLVMHMELWEPHKDYDRLGTAVKTMNILGLDVALIEIPVRPGRSLSTIVEIAARNWRLKAEGYDAVAELDRRLMQRYQQTRDGQQSR